MEYDPVKAMDNMTQLVDDYLPILCKELLEFEDGRGKGMYTIYCEQILIDTRISSYNAQVIVQSTIKHAAVKKVYKEFGISILEASAAINKKFGE